MAAAAASAKWIRASRSVLEPRVRAIGESEQRERGPADEVGVRVDGHQLIVLAHRHVDSEHDPAEQHDRGEQQEINVDLLHVEPPVEPSSNYSAVPVLL